MNSSSIFRLSIGRLMMALVAVFFFSCETDITLDLPAGDPRIVVEGWIEVNEPPFVLLTRNSNFFGGIDLNNFENYLVRGANLWVSDGTDTIMLQELCLRDLPAEFQAAFAQGFGLNLPDSVPLPNVCIYTIPDIFSWYATGIASIVGREDQVFWLHIEVEGQTLRSRTYIPPVVPVDSLTWRPHPIETADSMVAVYINFKEPDTLGNFVRYLTKRNSEPFYAPLSRSVWDDGLFNGQYYALPIERGQDLSEEFDINVYGYFWKGDTVTLKWMHISKEVYQFWKTLENNRASSSPFGSPVIVKTNIEGGLGIWGGYAPFYSTFIISE